MKRFMEKAKAFLAADESNPVAVMLEDLDKTALRDDIIAALKQIYDPEIPVNIYDLGLIYDVDVHDNAAATVTMTLTTPGCPVAETFPGIVKNAVCAVAGVVDAEVMLVWDPPWNQNMMTEYAKLELGLL